MENNSWNNTPETSDASVEASSLKSDIESVSIASKNMVLNILKWLPKFTKDQIVMMLKTPIEFIVCMADFFDENIRDEKKLWWKLYKLVSNNPDKLEK